MSATSVVELSQQRAPPIESIEGQVGGRVGGSGQFKRLSGVMPT
jgi:hypothetical protein